jgi:outer membrane protein assembly factor BamB
MRNRLLGTALLVAGLGQSGNTQTPAGEWPQWRGLARDGMVAAGQAPASWPTAWKATWSVEVGEGYSSPVASAGRLYIHSRRDPHEVVTALDASTGKPLWERAYPAAFTKNQYASDMAKGPNATPLITDGRVFTFGVSGMLTAWDAATGRHLWQKDFSSLVDSSKLFCGTAASPVMAHGLLVVQVGSDVRGGQIIALDPATGTPKWTWKGAGPGYASPFVTTIGDTSHLITMTNSSVLGVDARNGQPLWSIPFPDEWHENIATPIWTGTHLVVSGTRQGTHAYTLAQSGDTWTPTQAWKNTMAAMYMSTPVLADGLIVGLSARQKGQFVALDGRTGEMKWSSAGRAADHASVLLTSGHVVYLTSGGELLLVKRQTDGYVREQTYDIADRATYAVPTFLNGDLIIRDTTHVTRLAGAMARLKPTPYEEW